MHISAMLARTISGFYYSFWPRLRPEGYLGQVTRISKDRDNLEWETRDKVQLRQLDKLNSLIAHAIKNVPYYRRMFQEGKMPSQLSRLEDLKQVPILTKEIILSEGKNLVAGNYPKNKLRKLATGGSTGKPVHFYSDEQTLLSKNAAESWSGTMAKLSRKSSLAMLWGAGEFEPSLKQNLREKIELLITNRMFIDCFHMSEPDLEEAHRRLTRFAPEGLLGYTSALVRFARYLSDRGIKPAYPSKAVISAAETLDDVSRQLLEDTFNIPVFNRYGSREMGLIAVECERHKGLHIDCENMYVELGDAIEGTRLNKILVTKLTQLSMPFIRYDIGDLAEGSIDYCDCGRGYPVIKRIVGRVTEMIKTPDGGGLPGELFPHLFKDCGIAEYQVVQSEDYSLDINLVKAFTQSPEQDAFMRRGIDNYLKGKVNIRYKYVDKIKRTATGKLLPVISLVK